MSKKYNDIIEARIGRVIVESEVSNSFPIVGESVLLQSKTKWAENTQFDIKKSSTVNQTINIQNTNQRASVTIPILEAGDLKQRTTSTNSFSQTYLDQYIYSMVNQTEPYFNVQASSEIVRTDENIDILIYSDNGYDLSDVSSAILYIYNENGNTPILTFNSLSFDSVKGHYHFSEFNIGNRGYYDVRVLLTNSSGHTISKKHNKLITVTPRLAARPTQTQINNNEYTTLIADASKGVSIKLYETGVNDLYCIFTLKEAQTDDNSGYYNSLDLSQLPAGKDAYTIVLSKDYTYKGGNYYSRILVKGATNTSSSNVNGTPQFSFNVPLVFTIDQNSPLNILGIYYATVSYSGCLWNTVWDGRGYYNLSKGIKFSRYSKDLFWEDAFMLLNGTSDIEIFEVEICDTGFTAIMCKTDPGSSNPWFWKNNFIMKNFVWHHSYIHDTWGEGCYLGYYTSSEHNTTYTGSTKTFKNAVGNDVTYTSGNTYKMRAHEMNRLRVFRNHWERTGYDGIQISNATDSEFCYNIVEYGALKNEKDQASGASLQSIDGLIYNNIVLNHNGPGYQLGPYKYGVEFFNNICYTTKKTDAIQFLWELESPDQNPYAGATGVINDITVYNIHNNILISDRYTANGRNTVQFLNIYFKDNLMVNNGGNFSNMTTNTLALWESQKRNNAIYTLTEFFNKIPELKIADVYNYDFRIASDSILTTGGAGNLFHQDFRGYENWSNDVYPIGAYLGIFKKKISIVSISIENKPSSILLTFQATVSYAPANTSDNGIEWISSDNNIATVDNTGFISVVSDGEVTITARSTYNNAISDQFTASCLLAFIPTSINLTSNLTSNIKVGNIVTLQVNILPAEAVQAVTWSITNNETLTNITDTTASFTVANQGTVTVRATHKNNINIYTEKTFTVSLSLAGVILLSYGRYDQSGNPVGGYAYNNNVNEIGYLNTGSTQSLKDAENNSVATLTAIDKLIQLNLTTNTYSTQNVITPEYGFTSSQLKAWTYYSGTLGIFRSKITGITGNYRVRIFASNYYASRLASKGAYYNLIASATTHTLSLVAIDNNISQWMETQVTIDANGLEIDVGNNGGTNGYSYIPINAIILEPLS